jgi:hypothetical protein
MKGTDWLPLELPAFRAGSREYARNARPDLTSTRRDQQRAVACRARIAGRIVEQLGCISHNLPIGRKQPQIRVDLRVRAMTRPYTT